MGDFIRLTGVLATIGLVSLIIIELWGVPLFSWVFGSKWTQAGNFAQILIAGYLFFLVVSPMIAFLQGLEKIRLISFWNVFHFLIMGSLLFLHNITFTGFLKLYAGLEIVVFLILFGIVFRVIRRYDLTLSEKSR